MSRRTAEEHPMIELGRQWDEVDVREYGDTAVAIGRQTQQAAYRGQPSNGQFRVTHVAVRESAGWRLAGMHLSPIAAPPGRP